MYSLKSIYLEYVDYIMTIEDKANEDYVQLYKFPGLQHIY
jgi:hypothetical protein